MNTWHESRRALNLGNSSYPGMSCPYLRRDSDPDEQYYLLNWYLDPEYFLYEGCQCAAVRASKQLQQRGTRCWGGDWN